MMQGQGISMREGEEKEEVALVLKEGKLVDRVILSIQGKYNSTTLITPPV